MGLELLAFELSLPKKEVAGLLAAYHEANPYVKATAKHYEEMAQQQGYITTVLNRRRRFNMWEPKPKWDEETRSYVKYPGLRYQHAIAVYGSAIQRARTHTALSSETQGSNADGMKKWMVDADDAGVFAVTGVPTLTVHDELDFSVIDDSPARREAHQELRYLGEQALAHKLTVPIRVDSGRGPNWGSIE
jgi:DNA polymerase I-like protein with 3'-5' exonuclease and polymerase domains